jgi:mevalonate kinase
MSFKPTFLTIFFRKNLSLYQNNKKTMTPSKLLLFGEHTVNLGSQALAMPLQMYGGQWKFSSDKSLQFGLPKFARYLSDLQQKGELLFEIDDNRFKDDLDNGLIFESSVPTGYGVGSSGALCAAIYAHYGKNILKDNFLALPTLKNIFIQMENFFHGKSSGTDPLVCYLNEPLLLTTAGITSVILPQYLNEGDVIFLIDTGIKRKAEPLIHWFMEASQDVDFQQIIKENLVTANNDAIAAFLEGHWTKLLEATYRISDFQLQHLSPLIPDTFRDVWQEGLANDVFKLKICGAGGGGFILGITKNFAQTEMILENYTLRKVFPK